jgi:hypothetical protein
MRKHVRILGWLQICLGIMDLLIGLAAFGILSSIGVLAGDVAALGFMSAIGGFIGIVMLIMAIPNFICGVGLLRDWGGWVIILAVVLALFNLVKVPYGTVIAIYTFWIAWKLYNASDSTAVSPR